LYCREGHVKKRPLYGCLNAIFKDCNAKLINVIKAY
jgi:hypothetical protein